MNIHIVIKLPVTASSLMIRGSSVSIITHCHGVCVFVKTIGADPAANSGNKLNPSDAETSCLLPECFTSGQRKKEEKNKTIKQSPCTPSCL